MNYNYMIRRIHVFAVHATYRGPGLATNEHVMSQQTEQEWDVSLRMGTHKFRFVH